MKQMKAKMIMYMKIEIIVIIYFVMKCKYVDQIMC